MIIYGLTIISSDGNFMSERADGTKRYTESYTKLSTSKQKLIDLAKKEMRQFFDSYDFEAEDGKEPEDDFGNTVANFDVDLDNFEDICIQGPSSHYTFEFFERDLNDISLDITGITLLSIEEAKALPKKIRDIGKFWWLRSPGNGINSAVYVECDGDVYPCGYNVEKEYGVRPALIINLESSNLKIGDKFKLAGQTWTVISERYALCDGIIGKHTFRNEWRASDANDYEKSDVKKFLENWAREQGVIS